MEREFNHESIAVYADGKFAGVDNERACDLIEQAVNFGVKAWGRKEVMAIQIGAYWLEGWMAANHIGEEEAACLRKAINHYYFM